MSATMESMTRHEKDVALNPDSASWRGRLAPWTVNGALLLMVLAIGGSLYEYLVVDPVWPTNVTLIQPDHGGVNRKLFWVPLHVALTLALPVALWACWRNAAARRWVLVALGAYLVMRAWTLVYFVPEALRFEAEGLSNALEAQRWVLWSTLRLPLVLASAAALGAAGRRLEGSSGSATLPQDLRA